MSAAGSRQQTPLILYLLAFLVVGGIWWFWQEGQQAPKKRHQRWLEAAMSQSEIATALAGDNADDVGHALVQLQKVLVKGGAGTSWLDSLEKDLERHSRDDDAVVRQYVAYALAYWPGAAPKESALLKTMLEDDEPMVSLNAAIALAARGDSSGADRLVEAVRNTKGEQQESRRILLGNLRCVVQPRHRSFLEEELRRAQLDHDDERAQICREALKRLDDPPNEAALPTEQ